MNETTIIDLISRLIVKLSPKPEAIVEALVALAIDLVRSALYYSFLAGQSWVDNPLLDAYLGLTNHNKYMKENTLKHLVGSAQLGPKEDEKIALWYSQGEQGIPKEERIVLNPNQIKAIETSNWLDELAEERLRQLGSSRNQGVIFTGNQVRHLMPK